MKENVKDNWIKAGSFVQYVTMCVCVKLTLLTLF